MSRGGVVSRMRVVRYMSVKCQHTPIYHWLWPTLKIQIISNVIMFDLRLFRHYLIPDQHACTSIVYITWFVLLANRSFSSITNSAEVFRWPSSTTASLIKRRTALLWWFAWSRGEGRSSFNDPDSVPQSWGIGRNHERRSLGMKFLLIQRGANARVYTVDRLPDTSASIWT